MRRTKQFRVEGLERRLFLSSAIAAFGAQQTFATGSHPQTVAVADLNRDGKLDLAIANFGSGTVGVLLGNGNGTFQTQQTFAVGSGPYSVAVADVNGDGKPDLVTANYTSNNVSVLLGNGDGTFQAQQTFAAGLGAQSVAIADVNGDGKPDLVVADFGDLLNPGNTVSVLLGNGDGTFQGQRTFATLSGPTFATVADVNRDGKPDLIVSNDLAGNVSVLLGNGDGTFGPQQTFGSMSDPTHLVAADINGDGKLDLVVSSFTTNIVTVLPGNGDGTFGPQRTFAASNYANHVAVADVNGDGKPDIVVSNEDFNTVGVLLGNGDGSFQPQNTFAVGNQPTDVVTADVNGDGRQDIITTNYASGSVSVLLGDVPPTVLSINRTNPPGPITSDSSVTYTVTFNEAVTGVDPTDFALPTTGSVTATTPVLVTPVNGSVYSVTINGITGTGTLGLNLVDDASIKDVAENPLQPGGTASFQTPQMYHTFNGASSVTLADVNGDGRPDLVVGSQGGGPISVLLGNGNGTFQTQTTFSTGGAPRNGAITAVDIDGNGAVDLIVANDADWNVGVLLGNGNGTFRAQQTFYAPDPLSMAVADLNGDGKLDAVTADAGFDTISVLLGNGNGTFHPRLTFATGSAPYWVATADVNGDGKPDVITANRSGGTISVLLGNGDGTFQAQLTFAVGSYPHCLTVADLSGNGKPDVVVANLFDDTVSVLLGNGNGTFQSQRTFATALEPESVVATDVNGDGRTDIVVANSFGDTGISILLGNGNGTFQAQQTFTTGPTPFGVTAGDVSGDGRPDLLAAYYGDGNPDHGGVSVLIATAGGNFTGQTYTIVPSLDTITGTSGIDQITLVQSPDKQHIDWTLNGSTGEMAISDPNGLTINGNGSNDVITLQYASNGNPLPNTLHLNGTFTINGLQGSSPLLNTTLEIGRSTIYISYASPSSDPIAAITRYLQNGYNNGGWNGIPAASPAYPGAITSIPAAQNAKQTTAIGYADSADGLVANQPANTIELKYTLYGDTRLLATVGSNDFTTLTLHYHQTTGGTWDTGDFNYDGSVNFNDFTLLTRTYNTSLGSQASPAITGVQTPSTPPPSRSGKTVAPTPAPPHHHRQPKASRKHRRHW